MPSSESLEDSMEWSRRYQAEHPVAELAIVRAPSLTERFAHKEYSQKLGNRVLSRAALTGLALGSIPGVLALTVANRIKRHQNIEEEASLDG